MKFLSKVSGKKLDGKTVLLRLDLNIQKNEFKNSLRLNRSAASIMYLLNHKCCVVILSHKGRPKPNLSKKEIKDFSLKPVIKELEKIIGQKIHFIDKKDFADIKKELSKRNPGEVFALENLRFWKEEENNNINFAKKLSELGDVYANDAFAVSHRSNASVDAITKFLPSYAGLELESELNVFDKLLKNPPKPITLIIGGAKVSDKIGVIKKFIKKSDWILTGGGVANTFFAAKKIPIGKSIWDKQSLNLAKKWVSNPKIILPKDTIVKNQQILDIGKETILNYVQIIKKSKTVIWNGPLGMIEDKNYQKGTVEVAKALADSKVFCVVGGGETTSLILEKNLEYGISFLSIGGGAMLEYLSGKELPGLKALKNNKKSL
jgi:3-phosphoglycerate kinase